MKSLKLLMFAALMVAMARALSLIPGIPIAHTKMTWGFLARALCALVCGPVMGLVFGFVEDIWALSSSPPGDFFPWLHPVYHGRGAGLCPVLLPGADHGAAHRAGQPGGEPAGQRPDGLPVEPDAPGRGSTGGWFLPSLGKNLVTVLPKTLVIYVLFQALLPILQQMGVIPRQLDEKGRLP